jgi:hypothetical protein
LGPLAAAVAAVKMPHRHIAAAVQVERLVILLAALPVRLAGLPPVRLELTAVARPPALVVVAVLQTALRPKLVMVALGAPPAALEAAVGQD